MQKLKTKMTNLNWRQWSFIFFMSLGIIGMIYHDATSSYDDVWMIETGFSFSNMKPLSWIIPIFVWINVFYPYIRSAGLRKYDRWQGCYPIAKNWHSRFWGTLAALYNVLVFCIMIICTILCPLKESDIRDTPFTQIFLLVIGLILFFINKSYSWKRYNQIISSIPTSKDK